MTPNLDPAQHRHGLDPEGESRAGDGAHKGMEAQIDHQFGRVLAKLDETGIADETVVVFT